MDNSKLIHEFTDGTLEVSKEEELFRHLASNEESRGEFKQNLAMKSAINSDTKAYTPATASTLKIFSAVGFIPPAVPMPVPAGTGTTGAINSAGFFAKYQSAIFTGIATTLATAVIAYFMFQSQLGDLNSKNSQLLTELNSAKQKTEIPVISSIETNTSNNTINGNSDKIGNFQSKPIIKYVYIVKNDEINKDNNAITINDSLINDNLITPDNDESITKLFIPDKSSIVKGSYIPVKIISQGQANAFSNFSHIPLNLDFALNESDKAGLSFEIKKMTSWSDINPTINPKIDNKWNNTSLTLLYEIINGLNLGFEVRQETFFQSYKGYELDEKLDTVRYLYNQQPNFTSYGFVMRYAHPDWNIYGIFPYLQLFYGGNATEVGSIYRTMGGLKYNYGNLTLIIGAEYSEMNYVHQGNGFKSKKYDLNYGFSYGF